jgi:hypothetical protein
MANPQENKQVEEQDPLSMKYIFFESFGRNTFLFPQKKVPNKVALEISGR